MKNKNIIITGGSGLLGTQFVESVSKLGANVILVDIKKPIKVPKGVSVEIADTTNPKSINKLVKKLVKKYKTIDALVNNAYPRNKSYGKKFEEVTNKDFLENVGSNLGGYFTMSQEVAKIMMKQKFGTIIFMCSIYGFKAPRFEIYDGTPMTMPVEYAAIKGGILNLTKYLASYLGPYGIRVNAISPGGVFNNQPIEFVKKYESFVKLNPKRMANQRDIANTLMFLLSDTSSYITGQNIVVDGGWTL